MTTPDNVARPLDAPTTSTYVSVRLRLNIGHLSGWVLAAELDELLATAVDTGQVVPTLLVVERLRPDALPALVVE